MKGVRDKVQPCGLGVALSARHEQVEQDRTHVVQLHHAKLEGHSADVGGGYRQPNIAHDKQQRPQSFRGAVHVKLRDGRESVQRTDEGCQHEWRRIPPRVELHNQPLTRRSFARNTFRNSSIRDCGSLEQARTRSTAGRRTDSAIAAVTTS